MILETFVTNNLYNDYLDKVEEKKYTDSFFDYCDEAYANMKMSPYFIIAIIISLITTVVAGILAWQCNAKEHIVYRCINTLLSIIFSDIYVLYYLIYRVILKNKCY